MIGIGRWRGSGEPCFKGKNLNIIKRGKLREKGKNMRRKTKRKTSEKGGSATLPMN